MAEKERFEVLLEEIKGKVQLVLEGHDVIRSEIKQSEERIKNELRDELGGKIDRVHTSLKNEIRVTALAVKSDLEESIKEVKVKLEEHARLPVHA
jgi:predicted transcriptional regulator